MIWHYYFEVMITHDMSLKLLLSHKTYSNVHMSHICVIGIQI